MDKSSLTYFLMLFAVTIAAHPIKKISDVFVGEWKARRKIKSQTPSNTPSTTLRTIARREKTGRSKWSIFVRVVDLVIFIGGFFVYWSWHRSMEPLTVGHATTLVFVGAAVVVSALRNP